MTNCPVEATSGRKDLFQLSGWKVLSITGVGGGGGEHGVESLFGCGGGNLGHWSHLPPQSGIEQLTLISLLMQSGSLCNRGVLPTFGVGLFSPVKTLWEHPYRIARGVYPRSLQN